MKLMVRQVVHMVVIDRLRSLAVASFDDELRRLHHSTILRRRLVHDGDDLAERLDAVLSSERHQFRIGLGSPVRITALAYLKAS